MKVNMAVALLQDTTMKTAAGVPGILRGSENVVGKSFRCVGVLDAEAASDGGAAPAQDQDHR